MGLLAPWKRAINSAGRVPRLHRGCRGFEPLIAHQVSPFAHWWRQRPGVGRGSILKEHGQRAPSHARHGEEACARACGSEAPGECLGALRVVSGLDGEAPDGVAPEQRAHAATIPGDDADDAPATSHRVRDATSRDEEATRSRGFEGEGAVLDGEGPRQVGSPQGRVELHQPLPGPCIPLGRRQRPAVAPVRMDLTSRAEGDRLPGRSLGAQRAGPGAELPHLPIQGGPGQGQGQLSRRLGEGGFLEGRWEFHAGSCEASGGLEHGPERRAPASHTALSGTCRTAVRVEQAEQVWARGGEEGRVHRVADGGQVPGPATRRGTSSRRPRAGEVRRCAPERLGVGVRGENAAKALSQREKVRAHPAASVPGRPPSAGPRKPLRAVTGDGARRGLLGALGREEAQERRIEAWAVTPAELGLEGDKAGDRGTLGGPEAVELSQGRRCGADGLPALEAPWSQGRQLVPDRDFHRPIRAGCPLAWKSEQGRRAQRTSNT